MKLVARKLARLVKMHDLNNAGPARSALLKVADPSNVHPSKVTPSPVFRPLEVRSATECRLGKVDRHARECSRQSCRSLREPLWRPPNGAIVSVTLRIVVQDSYSGKLCKPREYSPF